MLLPLIGFNHFEDSPFIQVLKKDYFFEEIILLRQFWEHQYSIEYLIHVFEVELANKRQCLRNNILNLDIIQRHTMPKIAVVMQRLNIGRFCILQALVFMPIHPDIPLQYQIEGSFVGVLIVYRISCIVFHHFEVVDELPEF